MLIGPSQVVGLMYHPYPFIIRFTRVSTTFPSSTTKVTIPSPTTMTTVKTTSTTTSTTTTAITSTGKTSTLKARKRKAERQANYKARTANQTSTEVPQTTAAATSTSITQITTTTTERETLSAEIGISLSTDLASLTTTRVTSSASSITPDPTLLTTPKTPTSKPVATLTTSTLSTADTILTPTETTLDDNAVFMFANHDIVPTVTAPISAPPIANQSMPADVINATSETTTRANVKVMGFFDFDPTKNPVTAPATIPTTITSTTASTAVTTTSSITLAKTKTTLASNLKIMNAFGDINIGTFVAGSSSSNTATTTILQHTPTTTRTSTTAAMEFTTAGSIDQDEWDEPKQSHSIPEITTDVSVIEDLVFDGSGGDDPLDFTEADFDTIWTSAVTHKSSTFIFAGDFNKTWINDWPEIFPSNPLASTTPSAIPSITKSATKSTTLSTTSVTTTKPIVTEQTSPISEFTLPVLTVDNTTTTTVINININKSVDISTTRPTENIITEPVTTTKPQTLVTTVQKTSIESTVNITTTPVTTTTVKTSTIAIKPTTKTTTTVVTTTAKTTTTTKAPITARTRTETRPVPTQPFRNPNVRQPNRQWGFPPPLPTTTPSVTQKTGIQIEVEGGVLIDNIAVGAHTNMPRMSAVTLQELQEISSKCK